MLDPNYLQELIDETKSRGGGFILNFQDRPQIVVLSVERYNDLLGQIGAAPADEVEYNKGLMENSSKKILVTGGAGYIGSHAVRALIKSGCAVVVLDNLSTGKRENIAEQAQFIEGDVGDANLLRDIFNQEQIYAVMHFAASIEVEESVREPEKYLQNNTINTHVLLAAMAEAGVRRIIYSSTASVYGTQTVMPIPETAKLSPENPYGYSKLLSERIIKYYCHFLNFRAVVFRYFNACGTDFDGTIASVHKSHLITTVLDAVEGKMPFIKVNGTDYDTSDGTCVRDYVHVLDIAHAHVLALAKIEEADPYRIYNIGTGKGQSVREIINGVSEILNKIIPMEVGPRRPGDPALSIADNRKIKTELGFEPKYSDLETIITTSWKQRQNKDVH